MNTSTNKEGQREGREGRREEKHVFNAKSLNIVFQKVQGELTVDLWSHVSKNGKISKWWGKNTASKMTISNISSQSLYNKYSLKVLGYSFLVTTKWDYLPVISWDLFTKYFPQNIHQIFT